MKRIMLLALVLLLLTACSAPEAPEAETAHQAETAAPAVETAKTEEKPAAAAPAEEQEKAEEPADRENPKPEAEEEAVAAKTVVTLDGLDAYLRLTLPAGWTWTLEEPAFGERSILLTAPTEDGFQIRMVYWQSFGMCGTGVTFEDYVMANGTVATLATETIQGETWWWLILPAQPDQFTLQLNAPEAVLDAHQAELDAMLESIQTGTLSHIPPQPAKPTADK